MSVTKECAHCKRDAYIHGRGLCSACHHRLQRYGGIEQYPTARPNRVEQIAALYDSGMTRQEIADHLGMTLNAVAIVHRRSTRGATASTWEKLRVEPAPDRIACPPLSPLFFITPTPGVGVVYTRGGEQRIAHSLKRQVDAALAYCADCPLATRAWCVASARPQESASSMIAGGVVWAEGRPVWDIERNDARTSEAVA